MKLSIVCVSLRSVQRLVLSALTTTMRPLSLALMKLLTLNTILMISVMVLRLSRLIMITLTPMILMVL